MAAADAIVATLRQQIRSGDLAPGARVPSTRQLVTEWGVAMATASKALAALRTEGLTQVVPGVGTVVADRGRTGRVELSRERIVRTAIEVADLEGIEAVSIRRIAGQLGAGAMSLYRHVTGREHLQLLMRDAVFAERRLPEPGPADWRERLELAARTLWALYRSHPWLARTPSLTRPSAGRHQMPYSEWILATLAGLGLDDHTTFRVHLTLFGYVHGAASSLEVESREEAESGLTPDEWLTERERQTRAVITDDQFPVSARIFLREDLVFDLEDLFMFGLARLLDGVAVLVARAEGDRGPPARP